MKTVTESVNVFIFTFSREQAGNQSDKNKHDVCDHYLLHKSYLWKCP